MKDIMLKVMIQINLLNAIIVSLKVIIWIMQIIYINLVIQDAKHVMNLVIHRIINNIGSNNCETACSNYYYFNTNNEYICLNVNECPEGYKLIYSTQRCINTCANQYVSNNHYEYNNICYDTCPEDTYTLNSDDYLCKLNCKVNKGGLALGRDFTSK